jgi:hypothetical protein
MADLQKTKIVEVSGQRYLLRKMRPNVGSYILTRVLAAGINAGAAQEGGAPSNSFLAAVFTAFLRGLDFETFSFIQNNCLAVIGKLQDPGDGSEVPMPIVADSGVFADVALANNLMTVMELTVQSLLFNLADFFDGGGLKAVLG